MSNFIPPPVQERMNFIAFQFANRLRESLNQELLIFKVTGELQGSVEVSVIPADFDEPPIITAEYEGYGEFIGKRKLLWVKVPPIEKLIQYVQDKNLTSKGRIPGYVGDAPNLSEFKKAERIAWAIAISKQKNDTFKRRPWKKKALPDVLNDLNRTVLAEFANEMAKYLGKQISNV